MAFEMARQVNCFERREERGERREERGERREERGERRESHFNKPP
jgi:hypothetical protein